MVRIHKTTQNHTKPPSRGFCEGVPVLCFTKPRAFLAPAQQKRRVLCICELRLKGFFNLNIIILIQKINITPEISTQNLKTPSGVKQVLRVLCNELGGLM
jgi:hypothetical protein